MTVRPARNPLENTAMVSDLAMFVVLAACVIVVLAEGTG